MLSSLPLSIIALSISIIPTDIYIKLDSRLCIDYAYKYDAWSPYAGWAMFTKYGCYPRDIN